jgi:hypothetical protein
MRFVFFLSSAFILCHELTSRFYPLAQKAALFSAIKEYENNKWKAIGQKVGKPAKACEQYAKEHFPGKMHTVPVLLQLRTLTTRTSRSLPRVAEDQVNGISVPRLVPTS